MRRILLPLMAVTATVLTMTGCSSSEGSHVPPSGAPGPNAHPNFPNYAPHADIVIDSLQGAPEERDEFCRTYCGNEFGWPASEFSKSSIENFFQTPEPIDLRCDYMETSNDIGGSERHMGPRIVEQCAQRNLDNCYWSINYAKRHAGRVACVRPVFAKSAD